MNFVDLYRSLDQTNSTLEKVEALRNFFLTAPAKEGALAVSMILGVLPPRRLKTAQLTQLAKSAVKVPDWLFEEAYGSVGDLAETLALMVAPPEGERFDEPVVDFIETVLKSEQSALGALPLLWSRYESFSLMVLMKIMTGGLRIGVAQGLLIKGMAAAYSLPEVNVAEFLTARSQFDANFIEMFREGTFTSEAQTAAVTSPLPFALASPIDNEIEALGLPSDWLIEWKWDGIRGQWIFRNNKMAIWSRGEELVTDRFPELHLTQIPFQSLVLDGEILAWQEGAGAPLAFNTLQTRIGRKKVTAQSLKSAPIRFHAYDCLEIDGVDLRNEPLEIRRKHLTNAIERLNRLNPHFTLSPIVEVRDWEHAKNLREEARIRGVEGFILKRKTSKYFHGRKKGDWWKWKIDPMTLDAVLIYAQPGHGKRSNLFTDYTFALKDEAGNLVPVAKAYSGLDNTEISELDRWIRSHTLERFGPVRQVPAEQVFELGFEGIAESGRHKSGIALRFPRILRWRKDKPVQEIDRVDEIRKLYLDVSEVRQ